MKRERNVESYGKGSGLWCEGALKQVEACNPKPGEVPSEACEGGDPVDCVQSDWTPWSMCSVTCGGGEHLRTRKILRHPKYGGKSCDGALAELKECARHACGGPAPIDCKYSSWNHWGDCDKCNGEPSRVRNIDNFPSNGGEECDPKATMEIGKCPRRCGGQKFCEWTVWGTWSDCTVTCGKGGKRRRRRHLELTDVNASVSRTILASPKVKKRKARCTVQNSSMKKGKKARLQLRNCAKLKNKAHLKYENLKFSEINTVSRMSVRYKVAFQKWGFVFSGALDLINQRLANQNAFWDSLGSDG